MKSLDKIQLQVNEINTQLEFERNLDIDIMSDQETNKNIAMVALLSGMLDGIFYCTGVGKGDIIQMAYSRIEYTNKIKES